MTCLVLLLTVASIISINAVPIDQNKLPYRLSYLENYKKHNIDPAKSSYELRPQWNSAKINDLDHDDCRSLEDLLYSCSSKRLPNDPFYVTTEADRVRSKPPNDPDNLKRKRSLNSQKLYEKLIALGFDYVQVMNILEAVHQYRQTV